MAKVWNKGHGVRYWNSHRVCIDIRGMTLIHFLLPSPSRKMGVLPPSLSISTNDVHSLPAQPERPLLQISSAMRAVPPPARCRVPVSVEDIGWERFCSHVPTLSLGSSAAGVSDHTWNEKFKMPYRTVVVGNFKILPTNTLIARIA